MINVNFKRVVIVAGVTFALAACASKGGGLARHNDTIDWNKVQRIDAAAIHSNVKVIWVNPPQKKQKDK